MKNTVNAVFLVLALLFTLSRSATAAMDCSKPSEKSLNYLQGTACAPIITACNAGGYYLGCEKTDKKGLLAACFNPAVFKGQTIAGVTTQASDIAACKAYCLANKHICR